MNLEQQYDQDIISKLIARNEQLEQGLMMARAQIESSEMELRAVQIAYGELSQKYDQLKQEYEACFDDNWDDYDDGAYSVSINEV